MNFIAYDTPELYASDPEWQAWDRIWNSVRIPGLFLL